MTNPGIYIHIPFCIQKCLYCDFYSVTDRDLQGPFVKALIREIEDAAPFSEVPDTLYIGGGTPSALDPGEIDDVLAAVKRRFSLTDDAEITLEVNPGTVTRESLEAYRQAGINRLNIGVQAFDDNDLKFLGRCHDSREARQAISWARDAGFDNLGIDLIYGLPEQRLQHWWETLAEGVSFQPEHFSCYMLTYEAGTPLNRLRVSGGIQPMDDDSAASFFDATVATLSNAGYEHYEISNFSRSRGTRSQHNQKYWNHTPYMGFGPAAHSFTGGERLWNVKDVSAYIGLVATGKSPREGAETLTREQLMMETIYLGLRTEDGIDLARFETRFGVSFQNLFDSQVDLMQAQGLLTIAAGRCALTSRGMRFHDFITARFVDAMA